MNNNAVALVKRPRSVRNTLIRENVCRNNARFKTVTSMKSDGGRLTDREFDDVVAAYLDANWEICGTHVVLGDRQDGVLQSVHTVVYLVRK